jgi:hypothetical protein
MLKILKLSEFTEKINAGEIKVKEPSLKRIYRNELVMNPEALILLNQTESGEIGLFHSFYDNKLFIDTVGSLRKNDRAWVYTEERKPKYGNVSYKLNLFANYSAEEIKFNGNRVRVMVAFSDEWCEVIFDPSIRDLIESYISDVEEWRKLQAKNP